MYIKIYGHFINKNIILVFTLCTIFLLTSCASPPMPTRKVDNIQSEHSLSFSIAGDIMVHGRQLRSAYDRKCKCYNFEPVLAPVCHIIKKSDLSIVNLETTLPGKNYSGYPKFGSPDALATAIKRCGFDIITTANNHCMDRNKEGFLRTLKILGKNGLKHLGTYSSVKDYKENRILIIEKNNIKLALLNYTYGTNMIDVPEDVVVNIIDKGAITKDIKLARKEKVDFIIVLFHFGQEYLRYPDSFQKEMVKLAINEGADVILGGHPHFIQPYELQNIKDRHGEKKQRLIVYSLGNFLSNQRQRYADGGMIFKFTLKKQKLASGKSRLKIADIDYDLTWVYVKQLKRKQQFFIIPVEQYIKNSQKIRMSKWAHNKMRIFYKDSKALLKESELNIREQQGRP
ncbi:MAG: CapA family protein [Gammaproteobacteria bacterium]|nr:MAG: CapA family protein [Gammaproteobacteria bacterium]